MILNIFYVNQYYNFMEVLKDSYNIIKCIGKGTFGTVYLTEDKNGNKYASKVEQKRESSRLLFEYKIYRTLFKDKKDENIGVPRIISLIQTPTYNILVMELLGKSLDALYNRYNKKFELNTVATLGIDIITLLEHIHKYGFIHRDIKPNNFLIGVNNNRNRVYLTDFGLSRKYNKNGKHIEFCAKKSLIGTLRYASINMHMGIEPSRRDDMESVGYMLVYFLKGTLPWQGLKYDTESGHIEKIGTIKMTTNLNKLCENIPYNFGEYIKLCRELKFEEAPNYDALRECFMKVMTDNKFEMKYQWCDNAITDST